MSNTSRGRSAAAVHRGSERSAGRDQRQEHPDRSEVEMAEVQTANESGTGGRRTTPPFRADHVGSLLRPTRAAAKRARSSPPAGSPRAELRGVEDEAIREMVKMQRDVGLQRATDGEFRRASWHMDFIYQLGGVREGRRRYQGPVPQRATAKSSSRPPRSTSASRFISTTRSSPRTSSSCRAGRRTA